jgi:hypothetical protein
MHQCTLCNGNDSISFYFFQSQYHSNESDSIMKEEEYEIYGFINMFWVIDNNPEHIIADPLLVYPCFNWYCVRSLKNCNWN